jgi:hypothetical protein
MVLREDKGQRGNSALNLSGWPFTFFLLGGAAFLYLQLFVLPCTPIFLSQDHWIPLQDAREMLEGRVLYRDIFQLTFPGTEVIYAAILKAFGARVWVPNAVLVALGTLGAWLVTLISKQLVSGRNAFLPGFLLLSFEFSAWHVGAHHWFGTLAAMVAVLLVLEERSPTRLGGAGVLCGMTTWFTQTQGVSVLFGLAVFVLWECNRKNQTWRIVIRMWGFLLAGFVSTFVLSNGYFIWQAGLKQFVWSTLIFPFKYYSAVAASNSYRVYFADLMGLRLWELAPLVFVYVAVPLVYVLYFLAYMRQADGSSSQPWERLMLLNIVGVSLFVSTAAAPSSFRLCTVSPPALIILIWLLKTSARRISRAILTALWVAAFLCAVTVMVKTFRHERHWRAYLDLPMGRTAFLDPGPYDEYRWLLGKTSPSDFFFGGRDAYFYFPLGLRTPSGLQYVTAHDYTRPGQVRNLIRGLEGHRVRFVMWQVELDHPMDYTAAGDHLGPLRAYLREHYHVAKTFPGNSDQIWERND